MSDVGQPGLREVLRVDWRAATDDAPSWFNYLKHLLLGSSFAAVALFRLASRLHRANHRWLAHLCWKINFVMHSCDLSQQAEAEPGLYLPHPLGVVVGNGVRIGSGVTLFQGVTLGARRDAAGAREYPTLADGVTAYPYAQIFGPLRIGRGAVALAHAVVCEDIPDGAMVAGVPARIIRSASAEPEPMQ